ncbi:MAG: hypothetical protein ACMUJM_07300 [bacterium]
MVTDKQVRKLLKLYHSEGKLEVAALKAGMSETTARKYLNKGKLPSECKVIRTWRTRKGPFDDVWKSIQSQLELNPGLEATTVFEWLRREYPWKYGDGQIRTLQRKIKQWRSLNNGRDVENYCADYAPGELCAFDFIQMSGAGISIEERAFDHFIFHFIMPYSQWQAGTICGEKCFESLSMGLRNALWELGGVPKTLYKAHILFENGFIARYQALLSHYGLKSAEPETYSLNKDRAIQGQHDRFRKAIEQSLVLRGRRSFRDLQEYESFRRKLFYQLNTQQQNYLKEELKVLRKF